MTTTHVDIGASNCEGAAPGGPAWPVTANNLVWNNAAALTGPAGDRFVRPAINSAPYTGENNHGFWLSYFIAADTQKPAAMLHVAKGGQSIEQFLGQAPMTVRAQQCWNVMSQVPGIAPAHVWSVHLEGNAAGDIEAYPAQFNQLRNEYVARGIVSPNAIVLLFPRSLALGQPAIDANAMFADLAATNPRWAAVSPRDAVTGQPLTTVPGEPVHFDGEGQYQLGRNGYHEWRAKKLAGY